MPSESEKTATDIESGDASTLRAARSVLSGKGNKGFIFLVPLDGSRLAESVLPVVEQVASRFHAQVILLHIMEEHPPTVIHGEPHLQRVTQAQTYLEEVARRLRLAALTVDIHVHQDKEDNVARSIVEHAQEMKADLIIMCTHGHGGLREFLFGSNAQQALKLGTLSILLLFPREDGSLSPFKLQRILVPLDGTAPHESALTGAIPLARAFGAELHLVLVIPTLATLSGEQAVTGLLLPTTMRALLDLSEQGAADYLEQAVARCRAEGVVARAQVLRGDIAPAVLGLAERLDVDLIVLASHGRTGLDALVSGSVAPRITGRRIRPLLLVRAQKTAGAGS
jgi:nucleotide-binding universal stress UspA family protein